MCLWWPDGGKSSQARHLGVLTGRTSHLRCCQTLLCGTCFPLAFVGYSSQKEGAMAIEMAQWVPDPTHDMKAMTEQKTKQQGFLEWHLNLTWRDYTGGFHRPTGNFHSPPECLPSPSLAVASFTPVLSLVSNSEVGYCTRKGSTGQKDLAVHFYTQPWGRPFTAVETAAGIPCRPAGAEEDVYSSFLKGLC